MRNLKNKRALITGAASGIGRAIAEQLADEGTHLVLIDRDETRLLEVATSLQMKSVEIETRLVDLAHLDEVQMLGASLIQSRTEIDILINNAGVVHFGPTEAMQAGDLQRLMAVNLLAPLHLTLQLLPGLLMRRESHVVNVASIYGFFARRQTAAYHASKFGLLGWSESLRKEYVGRLNVTTVCPGFVNTQLFASGTCSSRDPSIPLPPAWLCTTAEVVAKSITRGIKQNRGLVLVTPLAYALYYSQRFAPWLLEWMNLRGLASEKKSPTR